MTPGVRSRLRPASDAATPEVDALKYGTIAALIAYVGRMRHDFGTSLERPTANSVARRLTYEFYM
jgi:hypothetical protein